MAHSSAYIVINSAALRHIRVLTGVDQVGLAAEVSISQGFLANLESGRRSAVSPEVFNALCTALRVADRRALMAHPQVTAP